MATKIKPGTSLAKLAKAKKELSREEKIEAFLEAGGKIQHIPIGVSGQEKVKGPKHITLGNKPKSQSQA